MPPQRRDLAAELSVADPAPRALAIARATVEALAGGPLPAGWTDADAVLSGRLPPGDEHRLDRAVARRPVLG